MLAAERDLVSIKETVLWLRLELFPNSDVRILSHVRILYSCFIRKFISKAKTVKTCIALPRKQSIL